MTPVCVAIYARVSSEQQATSSTINSQIAALEARLAQDGLALMPEGRFTDEGYSGATLVRPALERLRDAVAAGNLDRLYVHSPDRLARRYAYQVLLIDEFHRAGVEVVFLNRPIGRCGLLVRALEGDEAHGGPLGGFTDRLGIGRVVLLSLDKGLHVRR